MTRLWRTGDAPLDALAPRRCALCRANGRALCERCAALLCALPVPQRRDIVAAFPYVHDVRHLMHIGKFREGRTLLGDLSALGSSRIACCADVVVPVPLGRRRARERGYNQAAIIAATLSRMWGVPDCRGLRRVRETGPQVGRDLSKRRLNVQHAFRWEGTLLSDLRVAVVDDVATTGATLGAAADAVTSAGAREVIRLALACVE